MPPKPKPATERTLILPNKKASFRYELLEKVEAGLVLVGCEVKSIRARLASWADAYCVITNDEAWLFGLHIKSYPQAAMFRPDPDRKRKLLMHRKEIERWRVKLEKSGLTAVPTKLYFNGKRVKVELALARGKKTHDKRESIKRKDHERQMQRQRSER